MAQRIVGLRADAHPIGDVRGDFTDLFRLVHHVPLHGLLVGAGGGVAGGVEDFQDRLARDGIGQETADGPATFQMADQIGRRQRAGLDRMGGPVFKTKVQDEGLRRTEGFAVAAEEAARDVFVLHERQNIRRGRGDDPHGADLRAASAARAAVRVDSQEVVRGRGARSVIRDFQFVFAAPGLDGPVPLGLFIIMPGLEPAAPVEEVLETSVGAAAPEEVADLVFRLRHRIADKPEDQVAPQVQVVLVGDFEMALVVEYRGDFVYAGHVSGEEQFACLAVVDRAVVAVLAGTHVINRVFDVAVFRHGIDSCTGGR